MGQVLASSRAPRLSQPLGEPCETARGVEDPLHHCCGSAVECANLTLVVELAKAVPPGLFFFAWGGISRLADFAHLCLVQVVRRPVSASDGEAANTQPYTRRLAPLRG